MKERGSELQEAIEQCRTVTLRANSMVTELACLIEVQKEEVEGARRRNLILDSQIDAIKEERKRLEAVTATLQAQSAILTDLDHLQIQVTKLTAAILEDAAPETTKARNEATEQPRDRASDGITVNYS